MKILYITRLYSPHVGGVEKHVYEVAKELQQKGNKITILTERYDNDLKEAESVDGINVFRFSYPRIKLIGLLYIWRQIFKYKKFIQESDVVHVHDVFIWYLPFRFLYPKKMVFVTFHGWEGIYPIPFLNILQKRIASKYSRGTIGVGKYIGKHYGIIVNKITYGGQ